ncbi:MAG: hypothetical protein K0S79_500, partial [Nitrospira sp.]|nr:hypothetical protein [Nitrospira sp.]
MVCRRPDILMRRNHLLLKETHEKAEFTPTLSPFDHFVAGPMAFCEGMRMDRTGLQDGLGRSGKRYGAEPGG